MQVLVDAHQHHTRLQSLLALANEAAKLGPDMRMPEIEERATGNKALPQSSTPQLSSLDRQAQKDAVVLSEERLRQRYGHAIADRAIEAVKSQAPTAQQAFTKYQQQEREAKRELGRGLAAAGIQTPRHSVKDYTHVIVTQLELLLDGAIPSVSAVVNAAFPDDPKKATSIKNSAHGRRRKKAWDSLAVRNHPIEVAMQQAHGKDSMNRRHSARTFGQSLSMNTTLFKNCDRITKQGAEIDQLKREVQLLKQQMQSTKNREALADAGCNTSREKVLALTREGKGPAEIAKLLEIPYETVRTIRRRSKQ